MQFRLVDAGWGQEIADAVAFDHSELRIICPFIKKSTAERLVRAGKPDRIEVITRFNLSDFCDGVSDTSALRLLLKHGAAIRGVQNLHAKLYLFGNRRVMLTSANLTEAAMLRNHEFGFVSDDPKIVKQSRQYFAALWCQSGADLSQTRIDGWEERLALVRASGARPSVVDGLPDEGVIARYAEPFLSTSSEAFDAPSAFVKFFGDGKDRVPRSSSILEEVYDTGSHWACKYGRPPRQPVDGSIMYIARLVEDPQDMLVYGRAVAMRHLPGRDEATATDLAKRPWVADWPYYIRVHHAQFVAGTLGNGVSLYQMMDDLGSDAFRSTQDHAIAGEPQVNPRRSIQRQPGMELTTLAWAWLDSKLEAAFRRYGQLSEADLEQLDWPEGVSSVGQAVN